MIAVWMAYTLVSGALIALVCRLLEQMARSARLATRWVWAGGMVLMLLIPAAALLSASAPVRTPAPAMESTMGGVAELVGSVPSSALAAAPANRIERWLEGVDARVAEASGRLSRWDRPLLAFWALLSAFLAGVVGHAALEGRRLRSGLQAGEVDGTPVLLSEEVGPAAIGVGGRAILMPQWTLDLDLTLRTMLLRHEREHLVARDPLLLLLALLAAVLVPWNPSLWWARKRMLLAVEVDCDRRVLRAHPDVRRYGQLLLLAAQRVPTSAWASLAILTVVAPLQPRTSHIARRISAMTQPHNPRFSLRSLPALVGVFAIGGLLAVLPAPRRAAAQSQAARDSASASSSAQASGSRDASAQAAGAPTPRAPGRVLVHITSVGMTLLSSDPISIVVYTSGGGRVGFGTDLPVAIADTIRLDHLPAITADVTDGDVHVEIRNPGTIRLAGTVTGGPARTVSASGRHIVLSKGGTAIGGKP